MIIDLIEHSRGTLRNVEYVRVGRSYEGFTCLQVRKPGRCRQRHVEVGRIHGSLLKAAPWSRRRQSNMGHVLTRSGIFCTGVFLILRPAEVTLLRFSLLAPFPSVTLNMPLTLSPWRRAGRARNVSPCQPGSSTYFGVS